MSNAALGLDDFIKAYDENDSEWWHLSPGEMQNLFDEAVERINKLDEIIESLSMCSPDLRL